MDWRYESRFDRFARRRSTRRRREKGVTIYVPAAILTEAGIDVDADPPEYKLWATSKGGVMIRLYP